MARVAFSVNRLHRPAVKIEPLFVVGNNDPALIDSFDASIDLCGAFFSVNGFGSGHELCRIDHVWRCVRMQNTKRIRQLLHQKACAAGVVKVHVREKDVVDVAHIQILLGQCIKKKRYAVVDTRIDECRPATVVYKVARILQRAGVFGVDGDDAIIECCRLRAVSRH